MTIGIKHSPDLWKREGGPIFSWRLGADRLKGCVEAADGAEARLYGNLRDVEVCGDEEALGVGDAVLGDVVYDADGEAFAEEAHGVVRVQVDFVCYLSDGERRGVVLGDKRRDALDGAEVADGQYSRRIF